MYVLQYKKEQIRAERWIIEQKNKIKNPQYWKYIIVVVLINVVAGFIINETN